jgi:hypothetical protein
MENSDYYALWLGIQEPNRPLNNYQLLGLPLFESRPDLIGRAAAQQLALLEDHLAGPDAAAAERIVSEIESARKCLLAPVAKSRYDAILWPQIQARPVPLAPPVALPPLPGQMLDATEAESFAHFLAENTAPPKPSYDEMPEELVLLHAWRLTRRRYLIRALAWVPLALVATVGLYLILTAFFRRLRARR